MSNLLANERSALTTHSKAAMIVVVSRQVIFLSGK